MKTQILFATISLVAASAYADGPALRIYSAPDTVYSPEATIVAVTDPGASLSVQGADVKVFKTGSAAAKVELAPGANDIKVMASAAGKSTEKTVPVFYSTEPRSVKVEQPTEEVVFKSSRVVETTPGAYLQYGNGDDRLGGSKMGFIDEGIRLQALGRKGSLLHVALGQNRTAYIPAEYTREVSENVDLAPVNTGSWSVTNDGRNDRVSVALPRRLAYQYMTGIDPSEIVVDIFGAMDNSNWITQRTLDLGIIDYVDFRQTSDDVYRVIIRLKDKYQWGFHVAYEGNNLMIDVRHRPASLALKDLVIGLDAGHGGQYPGAISPSGLVEKEVNLDIVNHVADMLHARGARVVMTRTDDSGPSMADRKKTWRDAQVDLAVSVHNNAGCSPLSSPGTAVLYKHTFCRPMAVCMTRRLLETGLPLFGVVQNFNFSLNAPTEFPEVLVEGMFMSSLEEEEKLADPAFRKKVAAKIVAAIEDYLSETKK